MTKEGFPVTQKTQVADVTRGLASVRQMVLAGSRVVFDPKGSYIQHVQSGRKTPLEFKRGNYVFDLWVKKQKGKEDETKEDFAPRVALAVVSGKD